MDAPVAETGGMDAPDVPAIDVADTPDVSATPDVTRDAGRETGVVHICTDASECDDGLFCNGQERCLPGVPGSDEHGCQPASLPACRTGQTCNETAGTCDTDCSTARDADHDGHDAIACGGDDCDDADPNRHPNATEVCDPNNVDEDCNPLTYGARDRDGDGHDNFNCCNRDLSGNFHCGDDCNDTRRAISPDAPEICNGVDDDCDGVVDNGVQVTVYTDSDYDLHGDGTRQTMACAGAQGVSSDNRDCDDSNAARNLPQVEICDGLDNNCNGMTDEHTVAVTWYRDADGDGFGDSAARTVSCVPPAGYVLVTGDCDDADGNVHPGAAEQCNGKDDNCNGLADYRIPVRRDPMNPSHVLDYGTEDDDSDGIADVACGSAASSDCDDFDPSTGPGLPEICDGLDNDCNGLVDDNTRMVAYYRDADGDGFGDPTQSTTACAPVAGSVTRAGDCNDGNPNVFPGAADLCDGIDANCDGRTDEDAPLHAYYADQDGDGFGAGNAILACTAPPRTSTRNDDCDDTDPLRNPGATERCNGLDDDCDGVSDNLSMQSFHQDADGDGHASPAGATVSACTPPAGYAAVADDCDDNDAARYPGLAERCDGKDNDCNGVTDDAAAADASCYAPHTSASCQVGRCARSCSATFIDCDGDLNNPGGDGCERDSRSVTDCGGCGNVCAPPRASASCATGVCAIATCSPGYGDCNADPSDGCEADLTSPLNCGVCGNACPLGNSGCAAGACVCPGTRPAVCGRTGSARCADLDNDAANCGACGNACPTNGLCVAGACQCPGSSSAVCGGRCVDLSADRANCGACGNACPTSCIGGQCRRAVDLAVAINDACIVLDDGTVRCWGMHDYNSTPNDSFQMISVAGVSGATAVFGGDNTFCAQTSSGIVCWGENSYNQIDPSGASPFVDPAPFANAPPGTVEALSFGSEGAGGFTCALTRDSSLAHHVYCWGANGNLQTGQNTVGTTFTPAEVTGTGFSAPLQIDTGREFGSCAVTASGTIWCWGTFNSTRSAAPYVVGVSGQVAEVRIGTAVACARRADGTVACWGSQSYVCPGGCTTSPKEISMPSGRSAVQLELASQGGGGAVPATACVVLDTGEVLCWGNDYLGDGSAGTTTANASAPVYVITPSGARLGNVRLVRAYDETFCALTNDGQVFCWGSNPEGQVGIGTRGTDVLKATPIFWF